jgi:hypothetical protein
MSASLTEPLSGSLAGRPATTGRPAAISDHPREPSVELRAHLRGVGMWTPAFADFDAWLAAGASDISHVSGEPADGDGDPRPPAKLLHPRLRRRTSTLTRAAVTALESATGQGGASLDSVRFVLVSSFGEIEATVELLEQLAEPEGPVSPTKFHNSVHNTATGYMSIASGNHREATAIAGGPHNLAVGLLEALAGLAEVGGDVVLIFAEERLPPPFERSDADPTFAVALHLSSEAADRAQPDQSRSLEIELRLTNATSTTPAPAEAAALAPGVGGVGLPSMVAPLMQLLRGAARVRDGAAHDRVPVPIPLTSGDDPGVESAWLVTLHQLDPRG